MTAHLLHNVPKERHLLALLTGPTWMQCTGQAAYLQEIGEALWPPKSKRFGKRNRSELQIAGQAKVA